MQMGFSALFFMINRTNVYGAKLYIEAPINNASVPIGNQHAIILRTVLLSWRTRLLLSSSVPEWSLTVTGTILNGAKFSGVSVV